MSILIPLILGFLLLFGGAYYWWQHREYRLTVITPGQVYTSAAMPPEKLRSVVRRLGIRTVFDLRGSHEKVENVEERIEAERKVLEEEGVDHVNIPSPQVPTEELRDQYLDWIADPAHRPALMHCNHGQGRAVLHGALWRIEFEGMNPEKARKKCRRLRTKGTSFDPERPKGNYLRTYQPVRWNRETS
jgi:protein tyrosine/serine phosphatase